MKTALHNIDKVPWDCRKCSPLVVLEKEGSCVQEEIFLHESNVEEDCVFAKNDVVLFRGKSGGDFELLEVSNALPSSNVSEKPKLSGPTSSLRFLAQETRLGSEEIQNGLEEACNLKTQ